MQWTNDQFLRPFFLNKIFLSPIILQNIYWREDQDDKMIDEDPFAFGTKKIWIDPLDAKCEVDLSLTQTTRRAVEFDHGAARSLTLRPRRLDQTRAR